MSGVILFIGGDRWPYEVCRLRYRQSGVLFFFTDSIEEARAYFSLYRTQLLGVFVAGHVGREAIGRYPNTAVLVATFHQVKAAEGLRFRMIATTSHRSFQAALIAEGCTEAWAVEKIPDLVPVLLPPPRRP